MTSLAISLQCAATDEVAALIDELDAYYAVLYPMESNHLIDVHALCEPWFRFFVARERGALVGCIALRLDAAGFGEIKRLYVRPSARRRGIARQLLLVAIDAAREQHLGAVLLETGIRQPEAIALYESAGFKHRAHFPPYSDDPLSVFMELSVAWQ